MHVCRLCRQPAVNKFLDLGPQPIRNRFLASRDGVEYLHPLVVGYCRACGVVQLHQPPPPQELRARFDWITYNEPEGHLDQLAEDIARLPGLTNQSVVCGISYKDGSTLRRLGERGFARTWTIDLRADLGIDEPCAGIESVQDCLTPEIARAVTAKHGRADVVVVRHALEHSHDPRRVLDALRALMAPRGYLVVEVPDSVCGLEGRDYRMIWEEHVFYFTPATLRACLARAGFEVASLHSFPQGAEHSLVAIARPAAALAPPDARLLPAETARAERFLTGFGPERGRCRAFFANRRREVGMIAFLGAGHHSAGLLNFFGLGEFVEFVVDDNPRKMGMFMPGSRLPILPPDALLERGVKLCFMGVRPEAEDRVIDRNRPFLAAGGVLASIFPGSHHALAV
jgi:hypothetical protein